MSKIKEVFILRIDENVIECRGCGAPLRQASYAVRVNEDKILMEQEKFFCPHCDYRQEIPLGFHRHDDAVEMAQSIKKFGGKGQKLGSIKKVVIAWPA